ncbi:hypothetical protein [Prosthecomicrobium hirschii]|uniref:hypothetical protein n=1 Tax=Prosthecodimorpha hirschii TaxID=665126 RepID=UPI00221EBFDF|nr:hypothetical protein [Prosthecomicrobium hirschii]MCW1839060.1 hypothetical protein [Prosthecomicrobium hirschii]
MQAILSWMGRHGTALSAASVFTGLLLPELATQVRPWLGSFVACILTLALLMVEPARLAGTLRRPLPLLVGAVAMSLATPALVLGLEPVIGPALGPGLMLGLYIFAFAPPTLSAPAFAALLGLDAAPALALCLGLTLVAPVLIPLIAGGLGVDFPVDATALAWRLAMIVGPAVVLATAIRAGLGSERILRHRQSLTGLMIFPLAIFAIGSMDGIAARFLAEPFRMSGILALGIGLAVGGILIQTALCRPFGRSTALALGWCGGNRNLGLIVGAISGITPADTWAYFALAQFPIYALPLIAKAVYSRIGTREG